jgi:energy-coupling factor transporter ATP-binding protein EcfA2
MDDVHLVSTTNLGAAQTMAVQISESSPKRMLVEWANGQDGWVREAVAQVLNSNQELSDSQLKDLVARFKIEKGFEDRPEGFDDSPQLELPEDDATTDDVLELKRLADIAGVNALAPNQVLEFDANLTVLFGQNGAGKTGYSRVLKRLAAVRTAEPILPNAHAEGATASPSAAVTYVLNGQEDTIQWEDEPGVAPLTRMSVFDAPAVMLHVDNELNYVFTPREIALFSYVAIAVRHVQEQIESEAKSLRAATSTFTTHFQRGTTIYPKIETIGATTDLAELEELADGSDEGEATAATLHEEVAALKAGSVEARHDAVKQELTQVQSLHLAAKTLAEFDAGAYEANRDAVERLKDEYRRARTELFAEGELPGAPDDEWSRFISEADRYRTHLGLHEYPANGDDCLYCGQALSESARSLIAKYRTYLDDALARQLNEAKEALAASSLAPGNLSIDVLREHARQISEGESAPAYSAGTKDLVDNLARVHQASSKGAALEDFDAVKRSAKTASELLMSARTSLSAALEDLAKQKENRVATLREKEGRLAELTARRTLARNLPTIRTTVANAKRSAQMETFTKAMSSSTQRSLTMLTKQASEDLVNRNFQALFDEECRALRAPNVGLEFQGRRGQAERKKLVANYRPSTVLSEGEQKVLAIADFLAECRMTGVKAPIIFDDPVTSLDYLRLNEVAERISRLAETHQVVVLTHNIFFASTLLGLRTGKKLRCTFYDVKTNNTEKGILQAGVEPRQDTPADIGKRINATIQSAGSADSVMQEVLIERGYGLLRSWCEAFVEQELLGDVTRRHRSNVMMGGLDRIKLDRVQAAKGVLLPLFDRCSRFMPGHSQSVEQLNIQPSLDDLKTDWANADAARKAYIA